MKRLLMMKKYGNNFASKEKMLFHGTAPQNVDKINAGGLNRSYAGAHGKNFTSTFIAYTNVVLSVKLINNS